MNFDPAGGLTFAITFAIAWMVVKLYDVVYYLREISGQLKRIADAQDRGI